MTSASCFLCFPSSPNGISLDSYPQYANANDPPIEGDIYCMLESIQTPIERIMPAKSWGRCNGRASVASTLASPAETNAPMKLRPCIVIDIPKEGKPRNTSVRICAMATYEGISIAKVPEVYQHFSVGVSPNAGDPVHIHTTPEWAGASRQWVIAHAYDWKHDLWMTPRPRWCNRYLEGSFEYYRLSPDMLLYLEDVCRKKLAEWEERCQSDPDLISRSEEQLRRFHDRSPAAKSTNVQSPSASMFTSRNVGPHAPARDKVQSPSLSSMAPNFAKPSERVSVALPSNQRSTHGPGMPSSASGEDGQPQYVCMGEVMPQVETQMQTTPVNTASLSETVDKAVSNSNANANTGGWKTVVKRRKR